VLDDAAKEVREGAALLRGQAVGPLASSSVVARPPKQVIRDEMI
jgi:hypothetical protein